jgi:beta-glucanase (GH16 family)
MQKFEVSGHAPSLLPDGEWKLVWADEFDGSELDTAKWDYRLSMMGKRHPAWGTEGVTLDGNSNAVFTVYEKDGEICSSQLQTGYNFMDQPVCETKFGNDHLQWPIGRLHESKYLKKYGYFECRCRLQQKPGWWSAFWMQSPMIGASLDPAESGTELDIMECFKPGDIAAHNAFTGGYGLDMKNAHVGGKQGLDPAVYHTFGMLWDETGYTFYIDGEEDGKITEHISHRPEFILISTEVKGYRHAEHRPTAEAFAAVGDTFLVDHVRVFDLT